MDTIIMKIGGSIITHKNRWIPKINTENLERISREIGEAYMEIKDRKNLVLVHGVGCFGHVPVKLYRSLNMDRWQRAFGFAEIQRLQNELNCTVCDYLKNHGVPAFPFQASTTAVLEEEKTKHFDTTALENLLTLGVVPVMYGVPAYDSKKGLGVLSGDEIIRVLGNTLSPERIIHVTDVDGVFYGDPKENPDAKLIKVITRDVFEKITEKIGGSKNIDVSGGMLRKVKELLNIKGVRAQIINGTVEGNVKRVLLGDESIGTLVIEAQHR